MTRTGRVERQTAETKMLVEFEIDGTGITDVSTGVGFFDHMLASFGKHALVPMDEALVQAAVDLSGRPYLAHREPEGAPPTIGPVYPSTLTHHVLESFAHHAGLTLHVIVHSGRDWHHITEAQYKAAARALRSAAELDPRVHGIPSTKGV